jgi:two-component system, OmpR family, sensor histidine kinase SenX3
MRTPRVSVPITLTTALVVATIALTVGWQILVAREVGALAGGLTLIHWLLIIVGSLLFGLIIGSTILLSVWLVREMRNNQRQQNFIDAVTHELHTPLASLQLYLDTLRAQPLDAEQREEFLGIMSDDLARLQRTIDQILAAARAEVRRSSRETVDLYELLRDCIDEVRARHGLAEDTVRLSVPGVPRVRGDAEQLRVAFRNLIENAVRYAGEKLHVDIAVRAVSSRKLEVEVADQGVGIAPFDLRKIFQRFQRLSQDVVSSRGLGLGLYIVRNIVREHGGDVRAESEGRGTGSRFIVTLPGQIDGHAHPAR